MPQLTREALNSAMERDIQLHEQVEIIYVVDGWVCKFSNDDGNTFEDFKGETPMEALELCFSQTRNKRGR